MAEVVVVHNSKVGAPPGGRVHWFLWNLTSDLKRMYDVVFDYEFHNYFLIRYNQRTMSDMFLVVRSSRKCWRCMYFHREYKYFEYFSETTSKKLVDHIERIVRKIQAAEQKQKNQ